MSLLTTQVKTAKDGWIENAANSSLEPVRFCFGGRFVNVINNSTVQEVGQIYQLPLQTRNPSKDYAQTARMVALLIPSLIVGFVLRLLSLLINPDVRFGCSYQEKSLPRVKTNPERVDDSLLKESLITLKYKFDGFYERFNKAQWDLKKEAQLMGEINASITPYFELTSMLLKKAELAAKGQNFNHTAIHVDKRLIAGYLYAYHMMRNQTSASVEAGYPLFENIDQSPYFDPSQHPYVWRQQYNLICKQLDDLDIRRPTDPIFFKWTKADLAPFLPGEMREFPLLNLII